jgi:hypothetical protein
MFVMNIKGTPSRKQFFSCWVNVKFSVSLTGSGGTVPGILNYSTIERSRKLHALSREHALTWNNFHLNRQLNFEFEVLTAVLMKIIFFFLNMTQCSPIVH